MSYLSGALGDILRDLGWQQNALADGSGLPASQINRYVRGKYKTIPLTTVQNLLRAIPSEHHPKLVAAYVRDSVPPEFRDLVELSIPARVGEAVAEEPLAFPGIDRELHNILRTYAELAMRHPEIRQMLVSFLDAFGARGRAGG